ncbi:hypothetical protein YPPY66_1428 [Yersinia pestis PY-66]|nr:hypothetical protein YPPY03_1286 [Yersinia pestis PY-03]EIR50490.1 methionine aminopeptidase domain protein [Yersinia pestis PY-15]EIR52926.1 hypothetical protein YPPY14_1242 [Yersinia pestis PY-14]EIS32408.1 hypothetical protein YPPY54_1303 [Yersinia pestis PY-54]EIS47049.1 methionine aminopeptidase domain protein [Yersinia pestis PY-58]EIS59953.1 hypothetical protein YPPY63_1325 [Yersinia pestis PY-63]EIS81857.1 hypothetical protein YPPY66_1428 [Yersinia pestis PY-66]EIT48934.1 hypothet
MAANCLADTISHRFLLIDSYLFIICISLITAAGYLQPLRTLLHGNLNQNT